MDKRTAMRDEVNGQICGKMILEELIGILRHE
jgi:hypothetical protein